MIIWSADHQDRFPWEMAASEGGAKELALAGHSAPLFQLLSNSMPPSPARLVCPADRFRQATTNYADLKEANLSYFLNLDSATNIQASILMGDRHLQVDGTPVQPGLLNLRTNQAVEWTRELHFGKESKLPCGNIAFADGHGETVRQSLSPTLQRQGMEVIRLVVP